MSELSAFVNQQVLAVTQDGRVITGTLAGSDNLGSVILAGCVERVYSTDAGVEEVPLGLYIIRGDSLSLIGQLDVEKDKATDLASIRVEPIPETRHI
ncbi:hypothetical protein FA10DRAFT_265306 [Acaromyces ingoldii]|uniref:LSM2-LSM8 complex subunit LSM8 n=1 Tax=Acaromyces ingoldii TaxID=215250 RepID=A0A316YQ79_9BASI|nr:hypothetical protein FA10DRAFT_265306 [Acaromyces ingoldii]PWN91449.1 hypothetical protein FA10DRAFT_265306 [Acaromyces ingoldii]